MSETTDKSLTIDIDGTEVKAAPGQTILEAAKEAGIYIPHLCYHEEMSPGGHCRICTVLVNGKPMNSCTVTCVQGMVIENDTEELNAQRRHIVEMLFVEGNHICPFCEASGNCELQALAYRLGMLAPSYPYFFPRKEVDATHPWVFVDRNRCILCGRCVRASRQVDGKGVFGFEHRGIDKRLAVDSFSGLGDTDMDAADRAATICPTGSLVVKHIGYSLPFGGRMYDLRPIGSDVEQGAAGRYEPQGR